jgi:NAD(P)H-nitrite reductase large subunit
VSADRLDARNKVVVVSDGREYAYDKLLISAGGEPRLNGTEGRGVTYFRTLGDADHLLQLLGERDSADPVTILGSGFIAMEFVNIFTERGIRPTLSMRDERFFAESLDQDSSDLIQTHAEAQGVQVQKGAWNGGTPQTILAVGIGLLPNISWLQGSGLELFSGIHTNEFLETNISDVYAAGDIASFFDVTAGRERRVGNWLNALFQGRAVAKTMAGERTRFTLVSSYATSCAGVDIVFVGDTKRSLAEQVEVRGSKSDGGVTQVFYRGGRLVGATLVNRNEDRKWVTEEIGK